MRKLPLPRIALVSLGCPKNLVDSEKLMGRIAEDGCVVCHDPEDADVIIVNTCGFIESAKEESIGAILEAASISQAKSHPHRLIVTGCLAQRYKESLQAEIPEIDDVLGLGEFDAIARSITTDRRIDLRAGRPIGKGHKPRDDNHDTRLRLTPRHYAYLKVSEGCNNPCTYCAIPTIRGPFRSRPVKQIIEEAEQLATDGVRELILIAEDTTAYGIDLYKGQQRLHTLIRKLSQVDSIHWIRLLYTHPAHFYPELIEEIADNEKVCKYVDLPIQHINNTILKDMGRKVTRIQIERLIERLRSYVPGLFIRTSVIVGFPGETEKQFKELLRFIEDTAFERLGAFTYSKEEGTRAAGMRGQSYKRTRERRLNQVMGVQQEIAFKKNRQMVGKTIEVLIEEPIPPSAKEGRGGLHGSKGCWLGRSYGDAPDVDSNVIVHNYLSRNGAEEGSVPSIKPGSFYSVLITDTKDYDLIGQRQATSQES